MPVRIVARENDRVFLNDVYPFEGLDAAIADLEYIAMRHLDHHGPDLKLDVEYHDCVVRWRCPVCGLEIEVFED